MRRLMTIVLALVLLACTAQADNRILWQGDKIDCGGGGWWFSEQLVDKFADLEASGLPPQMAERLLNEGVPAIKRATIQQKQLKYRWYWLGFRFSRSDAEGIYLAGPGAVLLTFTDPQDPSNTFVTTDWGMLVSCDQMMNCFQDTANGPVTVERLRDDKRGVIKVWCLVRLPKVIEGRELDRVCVLTDVQPIEGKWEVIK